MGTRYSAKYHCLLRPQLCIVICTRFFTKYSLKVDVACLSCAIVLDDCIFIFSGNIVTREKLPVVDRDSIFAIRHALRSAKRVTVPVKRKEAEVRVELSACDNKSLQRLREVEGRRRRRLLSHHETEVEIAFLKA
jgi:hypothetical protein